MRDDIDPGIHRYINSQGKEVDENGNLLDDGRCRTCHPLVAVRPTLPSCPQCGKLNVEGVCDTCAVKQHENLEELCGKDIADMMYGSIDTDKCYINGCTCGKPKHKRQTEKEIADQEADVSDERNTSEKGLSDWDKLNAQVEYVHESVELLTSAVDRIDGEVRQDREAIASHGRTLDMILDTVENINKSIENINGSVEGGSPSPMIGPLRDEVAILTGNSQVHNKHILSLFEKVSDLADSQQKLMDTLETQLGAIRDLHDTVKTHTGMIERTNETVNDHGGLLDKLLETVTSQSRSIERLLNNTADLQKRVKSLEAKDVNMIPIIKNIGMDSNISVAGVSPKGSGNISVNIPQTTQPTKDNTSKLLLKRFLAVQRICEASIDLDTHGAVAPSSDRQWLAQSILNILNGNDE